MNPFLTCSSLPHPLHRSAIRSPHRQPHRRWIWAIYAALKPSPIVGDVVGAVVFADANHVAAAEDFARFLVEDGWLAHYLDFAGDRLLPPMAALRDQPFRVDTRDPHKLAAVVQAQSRPLAFDYTNIDQRLGRVYTERVWAKAVHRVAAEGVSPEQAVDEAITRIHQLLSE